MDQTPDQAPRPNTDPVVDPDFQIPVASELNLDAASHEFVYSFAVALGCVGTVSRENARRLFPDRPKGYVREAGNLRNYAWNKHTAMRLRRLGNSSRAMDYEGICDRIYQLRTARSQSLPGVRPGWQGPARLCGCVSHGEAAAD